MANIITVPIIVWKTDISLIGYVVCAVFVPDGLRYFETGVSIHLDGNAFNTLLCFDKTEYECKVVSIIQYYFSEKQVKDLEEIDLSTEEINDKDSVQFEKKGSIHCKNNNFYGHSNCTDSILQNMISDSVSFFDMIKTDKYEISAGNYIVLSRRSNCKFVFFGAIKVAANKRSRLPKYFNLVFNANEGNKLFSFSLSQLEKKIESSNFLFEKTHISLLLSTVAQFTKDGLHTTITHYRQPCNYFLNVYIKTLYVAYMVLFTLH